MYCLQKLPTGSERPKLGQTMYRCLLSSTIKIDQFSHHSIYQATKRFSLMLENGEHPLQFPSLAREIKRGWASIPKSGGEEFDTPKHPIFPKTGIESCRSLQDRQDMGLESRFRHFAQMFVHAIGDFSLVTDSVEMRAWMPPLPSEFRQPSIGMMDSARKIFVLLLVCISN